MKTMTIKAPERKGVYILLGNSGGSEPLHLEIPAGATRTVTLTPGQVENLRALTKSPQWIHGITITPQP